MILYGGGVALEPTSAAARGDWEYAPRWTFSHPRKDGTRCEASMWLQGDKLPQSSRGGLVAAWTVEKGTPEHPETLSPSIVCHCGFHGFIRDGRWVPA